MAENRELPMCPVETTLSLISDRWKVLILRDLFTGTVEKAIRNSGADLTDPAIAETFQNAMQQAAIA